MSILWHLAVELTWNLKVMSRYKKCVHWSLALYRGSQVCSNHSLIVLFWINVLHLDYIS